MPTSTGLPKVGEVWEKQVSSLAGSGQPIRFVVLQRSRGDEWSMRVAYIVERGDSKFWEKKLWVDCAYGLTQGWYKFIGDASAKTKYTLGLGPRPTDADDVDRRKDLEDVLQWAHRLTPEAAHAFVIDSARSRPKMTRELRHVWWAES